MSARDELLASLTAERYAVRPRPVDTLARVENVGRVEWGRAYDLIDEARRNAPVYDPEADHAARLLAGVGRTPKSQEDPR